MTIRILLADDHKIVREGLRSLLEKTPGMSVVAEAVNGREAVDRTKDLNPQIAILDMSMPELNGIEAARQITGQSETKVLILSMHSDRRYIFEAFRAGVSGYLLKDCAFEELTKAIQSVLMGQMYLSPSIAGGFLKEFVRKLPIEDSSAFSVLTPREREVLQLVAEGKISKEIAAVMKISVKTVETYRQRIMDKLNVRNIADLIKYAIREGLTSLEP